MSARFLLVKALLLALAALVACDSGTTDAKPPPAGTASPANAPTMEPQPPTRRVLPNCDATKAARAADRAVGGPARLRFLWSGARNADTILEVPVRVHEVRDSATPPSVVIEIPAIDDRERLLGVWQESGHVRVEGDEILLDPCSAQLFLN